ncbi:tRNA 2-thiouridine(34) synthase MnmA [Candidatus Parcubacteria bacterium]|nr:tRNA 2-thiouridine(34) synthase MnmA [Candidatus Parcubacteria bacterium]
MNKKQTVFVGLSGGVDSGVAAARLLAQGYNVVGVFIKVWHPNFMVCNWEQERLDAMRVAAHLGIPFLTCDAENEYRDEVAQYFINSYTKGLVPNPDVMCNQYVKFGAFLRFAKDRGADFIATGHYAQRIDEKTGVQLHRGIDGEKDQSYFLWTLSSLQLAFSLFPIGDTCKKEIRIEAEKIGLPVATKKDSQGICFLGHIDIPEFLSHYTTLRPGDVLDEQGKIIGTHKGALVYTVGQRHGFTLLTENIGRTPMFVVSKNIEANTVTVGTERTVTKDGTQMTLHDIVLRSDLKDGDIVEAQFRYRQKPFQVEVRVPTKDILIVIPHEKTELPATGQSCVLYRGSHCIGGGII